MTTKLDPHARRELAHARQVIHSHFPAGQPEVSFEERIADLPVISGAATLVLGHAPASAEATARAEVKLAAALEAVGARPKDGKRIAAEALGTLGTDALDTLRALPPAVRAEILYETMLGGPLESQQAPDAPVRFHHIGPVEEEGPAMKAFWKDFDGPRDFAKFERIRAAERFEQLGIKNLTVDALLAARDALVRAHPGRSGGPRDGGGMSTTTFRDPNGALIGTAFSWTHQSWADEDTEWWVLMYDHVTNQLAARHFSEERTGTRTWEAF